MAFLGIHGEPSPAERSHFPLPSFVRISCSAKLLHCLSPPSYTASNPFLLRIPSSLKKKEGKFNYAASFPSTFRPLHYSSLVFSSFHSGDVEEYAEFQESSSVKSDFLLLPVRFREWGGNKFCSHPSEPFQKAFVIYFYRVLKGKGER